MQISDLIPWGRHREDASDETTGTRDTNPLTSLQRDINRVFEDFWTRVDERGAGVANALGTFGPSTDVTESDDHVAVEVELPGMTEKDIDISTSEHAITIRGEKKLEREEERKGVYLSERSYGSFYRTIPLPPDVDTDRAEAAFRKGVLTIRVPKSAEAGARVKRIPVKGE